MTARSGAVISPKCHSEEVAGATDEESRQFLCDLRGVLHGVFLKSNEKDPLAKLRVGSSLRSG